MIYADANVIIRLIEGDSAARAPLEKRLLPLRGSGRFILTSQLSRWECRTKPMRDSNTSLLALYDAFFSGQEVEVIPLSVGVVDKATELRAGLKLKSPDALHLASAIILGASAFLTGDKELSRCKEVSVEIV